MIFLIILSVIAFLYFLLFLFFKFNPAFGGKITPEQKIEFEKLENYTDGHFINQISTTMDMNFADGMKTMREMYKPMQNREPQVELPVMKLTPNTNNENRITWFGHSTFLIELDGKNILIDPMFSKRTSPIAFLGPKRYTMNFPKALDELHKIDVVLISHDHYDHLDMRSIKILNKKCDQFIVPLGVDNHLLRWGVSPEKIQSLNWRDETEFQQIKFISTPARHFSGRNTSDRFQTLWSSWLIQSGDFKIYYSGDSSYGPHFKQIFENYGEIDLALLECGQYNEKWRHVHMFPEETVQAAIDLHSKIFMPIHWAGFTLSVHSWTEPVDRAIKRAVETNVKYTTPKIGQPIIPAKMVFPKSQWWKEI